LAQTVQQKEVAPHQARPKGPRRCGILPKYRKTLPVTAEFFRILVEMGRIELPCNGGSGELLRSVVYFNVLSSIRLKQTKSNGAADLFFINCIDQLQSLEPTI